MQYRVDGQRIIAFDDQEPLVGEISFPKVPDTNDHVVVERVLCNQLTVDKELQLN